MYFLFNNYWCTLKLSITKEMAIIADTIQNRLQTYIIEYRTKKARTDYKYYTQLYNEAKVKYNKAQKTYASFCDANHMVSRQCWDSDQ